VQKVFLTYNHQLLSINIGDKEYNGKNIDVQTISEILNENVYRINKDQLNGDKIVVDLGSNIGVFALQARALGAAKIYAVEPNPKNIKMLEKNILANNFETSIAIVPNAISTKPGYVEMIDCDRDSHIASLEKLESDTSKALTDGYEEDGQIDVNAITLAELLKDIAEVDIMKVDIEWGEYPVFTEATKEVMDKIKYLVFEFHGTDEETFGKLVANLSRSFIVETLGSFEQGGFIFCRRY